MSTLPIIIVVVVIVLVVVVVIIFDDDDDGTDVGDTIRNSNRCQSCTIGEGFVT